MNVVVFGGSGQLGRAIAREWAADRLVAPSHAAVDIADAHAVESYLAHQQPELVINCAAFHNVDVCEAEREQAFLGNAVAVDRLAAVCAERDIVFMTISTDYVFDGRTARPYVESDRPNPLSVYGVSKLAGELLVERRKMKAFVVRTCGIYGIVPSRSKGTFIDRVITQARSGECIRIVNDVVASPTYAGDLAGALRALVATQAYGLYHACNTGAVTWYDFAKKALELAGIDHPVKPISACEWKAPAQRPAYSALASEKLARLGIEMPSWEEGIGSYLSDSGANAT